MKNLLKKNYLSYLILGAILLTHIFIFTKLIYFPYPELFIYPYLTNHGLKPYGQILDQHFPGLMFFPINLDNLGMNTPEGAKFWSISIVIIIHLMIFLIGSEIFKNRLSQLMNMLKAELVFQELFKGAKTQKQIAERLRISTSTVNNALKPLERIGAIEKRKFGFKIKEAPVDWKNAPESHVGLKAYFQVIMETVKIRWNLISGRYEM